MIRLLNNGDKEIALNYLRRNHIEVTFLIGNINNFGLENDNTTRRAADYYGYFSNNELKGILPFYNLGSCIPHYEDSQAVEEFANIMLNRKFTTLLGMEKIVKPLYNLIRDSKELEEYSEDSYYVNNNFTPFLLKGVDFVDAAKFPLDNSSDFLMKAYEDGFRLIKKRDEIAKMFSERGPEEYFVFIIKNGDIKAQANIQTNTSEISQIGGVYTLNTERGNGYCKAVVSEICRRITARGKIPTLMVRKNNTPAVRAYQALGFTHYDDYLIITFKV
jgi:uncharacterized protein